MLAPLVVLSLLAAERRDPAAVLKLLEQSPRAYELSTVKSPSAQWQQQALWTFWPKPDSEQVAALVELRDGKVVDVERDPALEHEGQPAEALFEAGDFAGAEAAYAALLKKYPRDLLLTLYWGDAALKLRKPKVALERYRAAQKLNPLDYRGWFFEGSAQLALGDGKAARKAFNRALSVRPHIPTLLTAAEGAASRLGGALREYPFLPRARVDEKEGGYVVSLAADESAMQPWLAWGMCKAMWRGEPDVRKATLGSEQHRPSMEEEHECLVDLLAVYVVNQQKKTSPPEAQLEWLVRVQKAGLLDAFIIYELLGRTQPLIMLATDEKGREAVRGYLEKFGWQ